jgi:NADH:ubiquinone oxidoreductase subunit E
VDIDGLKVNVAVASSLGSAQKVLDMVKSGEKKYHFIEVMTCPGGCVAGGGQPYPPASVYPMDKDFIKLRASALYKEDRANELRRSHENPDVQQLYASVLEHPGSHKSHEWLHTHYSQKFPVGIRKQGDMDVVKSCILPDDPRFAELKSFIEAFRGKDNFESYLIPVMHHAQTLFGFLSVEVMDFISCQMQVPTSKIYGVATFYHFFNLHAKGKHQISVCLGTACYVKGSGEVVREFENQLGVKLSETTADGKFSLDCTRCIGACGLAPVVLVGDKVYSRVTTKDVKKILSEY